MEIESRVYLILNKELEMPVGKAAVQVGHGMDKIYECVMDSERTVQGTPREEGTITDAEIRLIQYYEWKRDGRKKVTLGVKNDAELQKYKDKLLDAGFVVFEIIDNGVNFFEGPTRTGLAVFPVLEAIPELKRLQVFK